MSRAKGEPVIFRKFPDGDVIALFGAMAGDMDPSHCGSYMHVGQHGAASPDLVRTTVPATHEEYAALKRELQSPPYEYKLAIYQRFQPCWYAARRKQIERRAK